MQIILILYRLMYLPFMMLLLLLPSCKKFLQIPSPETQAEASVIFADDKTAIAAVTGLYYQMVALSGGLCNGGITLYTGLSADEFANVSSSTTYDPFRTNSLLPTNNNVRNLFWTNAYKNIYQANAVIEGIQASQTMTASIKDQLRGEVLYARSLYYFYLVNLFGAIPLQTSTDYKINAMMPRTTLDTVYTQIINDLLEARSLLAASYGSLNNMRPDKNAATALLARTYLFRGNWQNASAMASEVIGLNKYSLESLGNTFLKTSKETIFQLYKETSNTAEGAFFNPASSTVQPNFAISGNLLNAFETGDLRKLNWMKSNTVSGTIYTYPYKYKVRLLTPVTEYVIVQRLAELFLIRAEARAQMGNLTSAIDDVDVIRLRAGLATIKSTNPSITQPDLLAAIWKERQTEFFAEWGYRWFDLKRTQRADAVLSTYKGTNWQSTDQLYPIPFTQIQANPFLTQNDGYDN